MQEQIHGDWDIQLLIEYRIVMIKGRGGWNEQAALAYTKEFKDSVKPLLGDPWLCLGYAIDWELGVPEMEPIIHELYEWMEDQGCLGQVTIVKSQMSKSQLSKMVEVESDQYDVSLVSDLESMMSIVGKKGFKIPPNAFSEFIQQPYPLH